MSSLYDHLCIRSTATTEEIKASYLLLCKIYHPARNSSGGKRFLEVQKAYTILKNEDSRNMYNIFGEKWLQVLQNDRRTDLILRICDRINFMLIIGTCVLIGLVLFLQPLIFCLFDIFKPKGGYLMASIPLNSILTLILIILTRVILRFKSSPRFEYLHEIRKCVIAAIIICSLGLQITIFNLYNEGWINHNMLVLQAPYLLCEMILLLYRYRLKKEKKVYLIVFSGIRILYMQFLNFDIQVASKIYLGMTWLLACMIIERFRPVVILVTFITSIFIVTGNINFCLETQKGCLFLFLMPPNIVVFGLFMLIKKIMKNLSPKAIFNSDKIPIEV